MGLEWESVSWFGSCQTSSLSTNQNTAVHTQFWFRHETECGGLETSGAFCQRGRYQCGRLVTVHGKTLGHQGRRPAVPQKSPESSDQTGRGSSTVYFVFSSQFVFFSFNLKVFLIHLSENIRIHFTPRFLKTEKCGDTLTACDSYWETVISILTRMRLFLAEPRLSEASRVLISVPGSRLLLTWETDTFLNASKWPEEVTRAATFPAVTDIFKDGGGGRGSFVIQCSCNNC